MRDLIRKYAWIDDDQDVVATVAVVSGLSARELVSVYGGDEAEPYLLTFADAHVPDEDFGSYFHAQVFAEGDYTVAIEPNGWTGAVTEIARRASRAGRFISAYWNVNGVTRLIEVDHGAVNADFEAVVLAAPGSPGEIIPDWFDEEVFGIEWGNAQLLAAIEYRTGLEIRPDWFTVPLPTYRIPDPYVLVDQSKRSP